MQLISICLNIWKIVYETHKEMYIALNFISIANQVQLIE